MTATKRARAAIRSQRQAVTKGPGYDGTRAVKSVLVPDPEKPKSRRLVKRNMLANPVAAMVAKGQLSGPLGDAGEKFERVYADLSLAASQAVDPAQPVVDTSSRADPIPDRVIRAGMEMARVARIIGMNEFAVINLVCGQGHSLRETAAALSGEDGREAVRAVGNTLRTGLRTLAVYWGFQGSPKAQAQINKWLHLTNPRSVVDSREWIASLVEMQGAGDQGVDDAGA